MRGGTYLGAIQVVVAQPVAAYAAAGWQAASACCCPGAMRLPVPIKLVAAPAAPVLIAPAAIVVRFSPPVPPAPGPTPEPETPPF